MKSNTSKVGIQIDTCTFSPHWKRVLLLKGDQFILHSFFPYQFFDTESSNHINTIIFVDIGLGLTHWHEI